MTRVSVAPAFDRVIRKRSELSLNFITVLTVLRSGHALFMNC